MAQKTMIKYIIDKERTLSPQKQSDSQCLHNLLYKSFQIQGNLHGNGLSESQQSWEAPPGDQQICRLFMLCVFHLTNQWMGPKTLHQSLWEDVIFPQASPTKFESVRNFASLYIQEHIHSIH